MPKVSSIKDGVKELECPSQITGLNSTELEVE